MEILNYEKYLKSKLINFTVINDNNRSTYKALNVKLSRNVVKNLDRVIKSTSKTHADSKKVIKKIVRIDNDLKKALNINIKDYENYISRFASKTILEKINAKEINLIKTKNFRYRINIHFTEKEYDCIKKAIEDLRIKGLKFVTFSLLVRSILYEKLGLIEFESFL